MPTKKLFYVLAAIALAVLVGHFTGAEATIFGVQYYKIFGLMGQLFINALMLVVVPLVASSMITGTAKMGKEASFGKLGLKTFTTFLATTGIAILIGWVLATILQPGNIEKMSVMVSSKTAELSLVASGGAFEKVEQILLQLIPSNIFAVASKGQMLGMIFFCLLFGYFINKIPEENGKVLLGFWQGVFHVMMKMTEFIMKAMPLGVFGLVAKVVATTGLETVTSLAGFLGTVLLGLAIFMFFALSLLLFGWGRIKPLVHLNAMGPALLTAFSTSSSVATLPLAFECIEKRCGVSNRIASFTLPIGTSMNLAGSSLQVIVSVFFIAQVYQVPLSFSTQAIIFFMTWLLSIGVAGIPSASLISVVIILSMIGFPADGVGLVMAVERILDMCRTTVNVYTNSCSCALIAASEKEKLLTQ